MTDTDNAPTVEQIAAAAEFLGLAIRPEHLAEAAQAWLLMAPHRQRVAEAAVGLDTEPAPVFFP